MVVGKNQKSSSWYVKLHKIQISLSINKDVLEHSHGSLFNILPMVPFTLQQQNWVAAMGTALPTKPKIFKAWFHEESLIYTTNLYLNL